jgi:DNA polymerase III epsilon subunit-like protein
MNSGTSWTVEMEDTLINLIESKKSIEEIGILLGRSTNSILARLNIIKKRKQIQLIDNDQQPISHEHTVLKSPSNTSINFDSIIERIRGKKVLILDLETTGLISEKNNFYKFWDDKIFNSCRIVEIGYWYTSSFDPNIDSIKINNYIRKPTDFFEIPIEAVNIHGISYEKACLEGYPLNKIMINKKDNNGNDCLSLYEILNTTDVFISHNTAFDFYVLLNELRRLKQYNTIKKLIQIRTSKNVICTCKHSGYKRLGNIYKSLFNCDVKVAHRAGDDVKTLIEIIINKRLDNNTEYIQTIS